MYQIVSSLEHNIYMSSHNKTIISITYIGLRPPSSAHPPQYTACGDKCDISSNKDVSLMSCLT